MNLDEDPHATDGGLRRTTRVLAVVLGLKACVFLTIYLSLHLLPPIFDGDNYLKRFHWPQNEPASSEWIFKTWDTAHYLNLSEEGYYPAAGSAAFHPLWPALIGLATPIVDVWGIRGVLHSGIDRLFFVVMMFGIVAVVRWEGRVGPWSLYSATMILVPAKTMSFMSFTRYPTVVFPIFMGFGVALADYRRRELRWLVLVVFLIVQFFFLIRHINCHWAG